jgi:hypothetical protein
VDDVTARLRESKPDNKRQQSTLPAREHRQQLAGRVVKERAQPARPSAPAQ